MEQIQRKPIRSARRSRLRKRRRFIKRLVIFGYRCIAMGILAIILILAVKIWPGINAKAEDNEIATDYPESLLELMEHNPETRDFVLGYFQNKDKAVEIDISGEVHKGTIPLFLQWDERWGYEKYGADFMAVTGCGPTCLSMVQCGLSGETKWNPLEVANMAQKQGFYVEGAGSSWDLMTTGAEQIGLYEHEVVYDEAHIISELESGNPIICIMGPGDFTSSGHFIVLAGVDEYGKIIVCDPNSRINSEKHWEVGEIIGQIRNLWGYTYS